MSVLLENFARFRTDRHDIALVLLDACHRFAQDNFLSAHPIGQFFADGLSSSLWLNVIISRHLISKWFSNKRDLDAELLGSIFSGHEQFHYATWRIGIGKKEEARNAIKVRSCKKKTIDKIYFHVVDETRWLNYQLQIGKLLGWYPLHLGCANFDRQMSPSSWRRILMPRSMCRDLQWELIWSIAQSNFIGKLILLLAIIMRCG